MDGNTYSVYMPKNVEMWINYAKKFPLATFGPKVIHIPVDNLSTFSKTCG